MSNLNYIKSGFICCHKFKLIIYLFRMILALNLHIVLFRAGLERSGIKEMEAWTARWLLCSI